jgi:hypothetical protein
MLEPRALREVVRTVSVQYPIPFLVACLLASSLFFFGLNAAFPDWALRAAGGLALVCACGFAGYAILVRPDLLRSERYSLTNRAFDIMLDKQASRQSRLQAGQIVESTLLANAGAEKVPHPRTDGRTAPGTENGNERANHEQA